MKTQIALCWKMNNIANAMDAHTLCGCVEILPTRECIMETASEWQQFGTQHHPVPSQNSENQMLELPASVGLSITHASQCENSVKSVSLISVLHLSLFWACEIVF